MKTILNTSRIRNIFTISIDKMFIINSMMLIIFFTYSITKLGIGIILLDVAVFGSININCVFVALLAGAFNLSTVLSTLIKSFSKSISFHFKPLNSPIDYLQ